MFVIAYYILLIYAGAGINKTLVFFVYMFIYRNYFFFQKRCTLYISHIILRGCKHRVHECFFIYFNAYG